MENRSIIRGIVSHNEFIPAPERVLHGICLSLSRFKLAGPPTPRDTEASNAYATIHDSLGPVCICGLIGINSNGPAGPDHMTMILPQVGLAAAPKRKPTVRAS